MRQGCRILFATRRSRCRCARGCGLRGLRLRRLLLGSLAARHDRQQQHQSHRHFEAGELRPDFHVLGVYSACPAASWRARRRFGCTSHAIRILTRYNPTMGAAKMHMFMMSVVGVTIAAIMKITRMEYLRLRHIHPGLITPIKDRKNTRIGISKMTPSPMMIVRNRSVYSPIVIIGLNCCP